MITQMKNGISSLDAKAGAKTAISTKANGERNSRERKAMSRKIGRLMMIRPSFKSVSFILPGQLS